MGSDKLFQKKKMRSAQELSRQKAKRSPYELMHIICEGQTEYGYIKTLIQFYRLNTANVTVSTGQGSAPISIIEEGFELAKSQSGIDRIIFVFDRDNHESYGRAINHVASHKHSRNDKSKPLYDIITSTPCFEIWLLLHFRLTTKVYNKSGNKTPADHLITDLRQNITHYQKTGVGQWFEQVQPLIETAIKNSMLLAAHNKKANSTNPSTNFHELIYLFKTLKK